MVKYLFLSVFVCLSAFAQEAKPFARSHAGRTVYTYNFSQLEKRLQAKSDTVYVVNFWATWCAPCVKELPYFDRIGTEYKSQKVKVLLVSLDMNKQVESSLLPFLIRKNIRQEVIHLHEPDANAWIPKVNAQWSGALPATLIFTAADRKFYERSFTYEELEQEVKHFLK
ncbi:Thioredoxin domain-containing protein [Flavobacterium longum]|uniref:TlpA family protein disulfide reductase n=1 Tax=Flavobacterium longum TaxID=1299340 RepID=UPI0039EA2E34